MTFDSFAASVAEVHGGVPFGGDVGGPLAPWLPVEGVALVVGFGGGEVEHEGSDGVRILVEEMIEIRLSELLSGHDNRTLHPREHGDERADLRGVSGFRTDDVDGGFVG